MKVMFVNAKSNADIKLTEKSLQQLKGLKLGVATTIQHLHKIKDVLSQLDNAVLVGQVLGCRVENTVAKKETVDAFLYVGTGEFHPLKIALETKKPVYCWNPIAKELKQISESEIKKLEQRKKAGMLKFYNAKKVGIIVSTKPGQTGNKINNSAEKKLEAALKLKQRGDKKYYIFAADTIQLNELENFPFIDCWVNTACPRIVEDKAGIVNMSNII